MNTISYGDYDFNEKDFQYVDTQLLYANNSPRKFTGVVIDRKTNDGHQLFVYNIFPKIIHPRIRNHQIKCFGRDTTCFWIRTDNDYFIFYDVFDKNQIKVISPECPIHTINRRYDKAMYTAFNESKAGETYYAQH